MLYVTRLNSKKNPDKTFLALIYENERKKFFLSLDTSEIARILDYRYSELDGIKVGDVIPVI